jgi:hypothetical protein
MFKIPYWMFLMTVITSCSTLLVKPGRYLDASAIYPLALQGNLKPVLTDFEQVSDLSLTTEQLQLKRSYQERFSDNPPIDVTYDDIGEPWGIIYKRDLFLDFGA